MRVSVNTICLVQFNKFLLFLLLLLSYLIYFSGKYIIPLVFKNNLKSFWFFTFIFSVISFEIIKNDEFNDLVKEIEEIREIRIEKTHKDKKNVLLFGGNILFKQNK